MNVLPRREIPAIIDHVLPPNRGLLRISTMAPHGRTRLALLVFVVVWLLLRVPHLGAPYSFDWDSSQFARGVTEFNVLKHQPQPPGYPLWVFSAKLLSPVAGGPMRAQIVTALVMSLLALAAFHALAKRVLSPEGALASTVLLAFSPAVSLHSSVPLSIVTDLLSSSLAGYLAFLDPRSRRWRIVAVLTALGVLAGFRQSGVTLLAPLVALAMWRHWRRAWRALCAGVFLGGFAFLSWYIPLARSAGGWRVLLRLTSQQFRSSASITSVFYGASLQRHVSMIEENLVYFAMNAFGWLVACGFVFRQRRREAAALARDLRNRSDWWLYALWLVPNLMMLFLFHGAKVGYCLLSFPPLLLLAASIVKQEGEGVDRGRWLPATLTGVLACLAISYFPYGRLLSSQRSAVDYLLYRSTPRMALELDESQRHLDSSLRELEHSGAPQPFVCARNLPEAPNIRTVTYDFSYLRWVTAETALADPRIVPASSVWLFDWRGPGPDLRSRYPRWRRIAGDQLVSLWETSP